MKRFVHNRPTLDVNNSADLENIYSLCNALGNKKRLEILRVINSPPFRFSVSQLSAKLKMPISTLMHHLSVLENASIVKFQYHPSPSGDIRIYSRALVMATLLLYNNEMLTKKDLLVNTQSLKVGCFADFQGETLNMVTKKEIFYTLGNSCFIPQRTDAELIFSPLGTIEYYFDNFIAKTHKVDSITLSLEICSEAPFFDPNYKSEITFWINGVELATHTLVGDFGDRPGKLNPEWWRELQNTQYGQVLTLTVNDSGVLINGTLVNRTVKLEHLRLENGNKLSFKFGNKNTATFPGGFNVFGSGFGDFDQDIVLQMLYETQNATENNG